MSHLFTDEDDGPIRFFIQQGLPESIAGPLIEEIESNGGAITDRIPVKGFVIAEPESQNGSRLIQHWRDSGKPNRYFVPTAFVGSCIRANKVHEQIFLEDNTPILFHIHESVVGKMLRQKCKERILCVGGDPSAMEEESKIIIVDEKQCDALAQQYENSEQYIETPSWIKQCIDADKYEHSSLVRKNIGGRPIGGKRNSFTEKEDVLLAHYIARVIPDKSMSGRTGNNIYIRLVEMGKDGTPGYEWATRHTWHSWRNRYKTHMHRIDGISEEYRLQNNIQPGNKGQYAFVRKRSTQKSPAKASREPEARSGSEQESPRKKRKSPTPDIPETPTKVSKPRARKSSPPAYSEQPVDESQWVIRVGNDDPPPWAKRSSPTEAAGTKRALSNSSPEGLPKRPRLGPTVNQSNVRTEIAADQATEAHLEKIADRYRWHIDEVRQEYQKTGDLISTQDAIASYRRVIEEYKLRQELDEN